MAGKLGELQSIVYEQNNFFMDILKKEGFKFTEEQTEICRKLLAKMGISFFPLYTRPDQQQAQRQDEGIVSVEP